MKYALFFFVDVFNALSIGDKNNGIYTKELETITITEKQNKYVYQT